MTDLDTLMQALAASEAERALALAQAQPALLAQRDAAGRSALSMAAYTGQQALLAPLRALRGAPDFHEASLLGDAERVEALLAAGQDVNAPAPDGFAPMALAAFFGHTGLALHLLAAGADPNRRADNAQQVNALHAAVARADVALVEALLSAGADPNLPQAGGVTPWMGAASRGNHALLGLLLLFGADPLQRDTQGRSAAELARGHGQAALADWLTQRFPDAEAPR